MSDNKSTDKYLAPKKLGRIIFSTGTFMFFIAFVISYTVSGDSLINPPISSQLNSYRSEYITILGVLSSSLILIIIGGLLAIAPQFISSNESEGTNYVLVFAYCLFLVSNIITIVNRWPGSDIGNKLVNYYISGNLTGGSLQNDSTITYINTSSILTLISLMICGLIIFEVNKSSGIKIDLSNYLILTCILCIILEVIVTIILTTFTTDG